MTTQELFDQLERYAEREGNADGEEARQLTLLRHFRAALPRVAAITQRRGQLLPARAARVEARAYRTRGAGMTATKEDLRAILASALATFEQELTRRDDVAYARAQLHDALIDAGREDVAHAFALSVAARLAWVHGRKEMSWKKHWAAVESWSALGLPINLEDPKEGAHVFGIFRRVLARCAEVLGVSHDS